MHGLSMVDLIGRLSNPRAEPVRANFGDDLEHSAQVVEPVPRPSRPRRRRLTGPEVSDLLEGYRAGEKLGTLASRLGTSKDTDIREVTRAGIAKRSESLGWSGDDLLAAAEMYRAGASLASVGERFGIGSTTVWDRFRAAGISLRPRNGW